MLKPFEPFEDGVTERPSAYPLIRGSLVKGLYIRPLVKGVAS